MERAIAAAAALVLAGCATRPPLYTSPTYTQQSFAADKLNCLKQSKVPTVYGGVEGMTNNEALFQTCMEAHGYRRTQ